MEAWRLHYIEESGFLLQIWDIEEDHILCNYINHIGHTCRLIVPFPNKPYKIEYTFCSMVLLFVPTPMPGYKDYFIVNPFKNFFTHIGLIETRHFGFFSLIRNIGEQKYGWIVVKSLHDENGPDLFFIWNIMYEYCRCVIAPDGEPIRPKDAMFFKGKLY